ncbi:hypothetical protein JCM10213_006164 [Rhodosporidiobolus nylandii]
MALIETGECCVCGEETANRCGACAEADLFVCSREHQKLIWPVHKRVCGPRKCSPFCWPDLTHDEVDAVLKIMHIPIFSASGTRTTLAQSLLSLRTLRGLSTDQLQHVIRSSGHQVPDRILDLAPRQSVLMVVRGTFGQFLGVRDVLGAPPPDDKSELAFDDAAKAFMDAVPILSKAYSGVVELNTAVCHFLLVRATLRQLHSDKPTAETFKSLAHAEHQLLEEFEGLVRARCSEAEAKQLVAQACEV